MRSWAGMGYDPWRLVLAVVSAPHNQHCASPWEKLQLSLLGIGTKSCNKRGCKVVLNHPMSIQ